MKLNPWDMTFDFPTVREALDRTGFHVTALPSPWIAGWHHGVAVRP